MQIRQYSCYESLTEVLAFGRRLYSQFLNEQYKLQTRERERDTHTEREREGETRTQRHTQRGKERERYICI